MAAESVIKKNTVNWEEQKENAKWNYFDFPFLTSFGPLLSLA